MALRKDDISPSHRAHPTPVLPSQGRAPPHQTLVKGTGNTLDMCHDHLPDPGSPQSAISWVLSISSAISLWQAIIVSCVTPNHSQAFTHNTWPQSFSKLQLEWLFQNQFEHITPPV